MRTSNLRSFLLISAAAMLTGCAGFSSLSTTTPVAAPTGFSLRGMHGVVHGGQQPIGYASLQIYQAGNSGYGTGATPLIPAGSYYAGGASGCISSGTQTCYSNVVTDATGNFSITNDYTCAKGTQVYLASTGGQPTTGVANAAVDLLAGLGLCDNVGAGTNVNMNEVTTVGTVWALTAFMPSTGSGISPLNIGSSSTNPVGLVNAFSDIPSLVNIAGGSALASSSGITLPTAQVNTLANILAACINSGGASSSACSALFAKAPSADNTLPADVVSAALNIARNPGRNVADLINIATSVGAPFAPTVSSAVDLTLAMTYTGSGISSPSGAAMDANGTIWIANSGNNSVTMLAHNFASAGNYTAGSLNAPSALAIDGGGNVWIANGGGQTLTELTAAGANVAGSPFSGGGLAQPSGVAFDGSGNAWLSNAGNNAVSEFSATGSALSGTGYFATGVSAPVGIAINPR